MKTFDADLDLTIGSNTEGDLYKPQNTAIPSPSLPSSFSSPPPRSPLSQETSTSPINSNKSYIPKIIFGLFLVVLLFLSWLWKENSSWTFFPFFSIDESSEYVSSEPSSLPTSRPSHTQKFSKKKSSEKVSIESSKPSYSSAIPKKDMTKNLSLKSKLTSTSKVQEIPLKKVEKNNFVQKNSLNPHLTESSFSSMSSWQKYFLARSFHANGKKSDRLKLKTLLKEPEFWVRMTALTALADLGEKIKISDIKSCFKGVSSSLLTSWFLRYQEGSTLGEKKIMKLSLGLLPEKAQKRVIESLKNPKIRKIKKFSSIELANFFPKK